MMNAARWPARGSSIRRSSRASATSSCSRETVVDGFINGLHRAPFFGASIDFAEHRGYVAGDDIRRVDWRLYARTDRYYVKQYEADTNTNFTILLDISRSMRFSSGGVSKLEYGSFLGACLLPRARGSATASASSPSTTTSSTHVPPSAKHFDMVLHTLDRAKAERPGHLSAPLNKMAEHFKRRGILLLISDFYDEPDAILEAIKPLRFLGNDLIVFHVLDPQEIDFDYDDASSFEDLESGEQIPVVPAVVPRAVSRADPGAHRRADDEVLGAADRLRAAQHRRAARPRAVQLSVEPREADEGAVSDGSGSQCFMSPVNVFSSPALLRRPRRDRHSDPRAPDSARAEARRRVPVADVRAEDSVSVGAAAADPPLVRCC